MIDESAGRIPYTAPSLVRYGSMAALTRGQSGSFCDGNSGMVGGSNGCRPEPNGNCPMAGCQ